MSPSNVTLIFLLVLAVFNVAEASGKGKYGPQRTEVIDMPVKINQNCDFSKVTIGDLNGKNECTPVVTQTDIEKGVRGIFLNGPNILKINSVKRVPGLGKSALIPICALSILDTTHLNAIKEKELIVVVDASTNATFTGSLVSEDTVVPVKLNSKKSDSQNAAGNVLVIEPNYTQTTSFNFDLTEHVQLPEKNATYHIYMTIGPYKSNVVTTKIVLDK
jgi:hypothetical protein